MIWFRRPPGPRDVLAAIQALRKDIQAMSTAFDRVVSKIAELKTVEEGVVAVVDSLATQIGALRDQLAHQEIPVTAQQLDDIVTQLEAVRAPLATAVVAGTIAEQAPAPSPAADATTSADAGNDTLLGGQGNDSLVLDATNDTVLGGQGDDSLAAPAGDATLAGGEANDALPEGAGNDLITE